MRRIKATETELNGRSMWEMSRGGQRSASAIISLRWASSFLCAMCKSSRLGHTNSGKNENYSSTLLTTPCWSFTHINNYVQLFLFCSYFPPQLQFVRLLKLLMLFYVVSERRCVNSHILTPRRLCLLWHVEKFSCSRILFFPPRVCSEMTTTAVLRFSECSQRWYSEEDSETQSHHAS